MTSLRNKIGQMLIMGFDGCEIHDNSPVADWLSGDGLGGVLLFDKDLATGLYGKNLKSKPQIKQLIATLRNYDAKRAYANELPLLTAIDYEGGFVDRLTQIDGCIRTLNAIELAQLSDDALEAELSRMALTLKSLGFNLNFAPVVDLHMHDNHGIIGALKRSFSADPETVNRIASKFIEVFYRYGIASCYKHFPGHGSALGDTHEGFVDVTDTFLSTELEPYYQLIHHSNKPVMVMTAHVINQHLDSQGLPATLSHQVLTGLLRQRIGYDGVIISDDLQMQAIAHHYSLEESLRLTINAGADMLIFANQLGCISAPEIIRAIEQLVKEQEINEQRINEAYSRILRLKHQVCSVEMAN